MRLSASERIDIGAAVPNENAIVATKNCFIISSIGATDSPERIHLEWYREYILRPVFSQFPNYHFCGSAEINTPGMIDTQIINHLLDDDLVIADMTFLNANVFYEIGIRHSARKPIIHTYRNTGAFKMPFDVNSYRSVEYDMHRPAAIKNAQEDLLAHINEVERTDYSVDNPITRARAAQDMRDHGTPMEKALLARIEALEARQARFGAAQLDNDDQTTYRRTNRKPLLIKDDFNDFILTLTDDDPDETIRRIRIAIVNLDITEHSLYVKDNEVFIRIGDLQSSPSKGLIAREFGYINGVKDVKMSIRQPID